MKKKSVSSQRSLYEVAKDTFSYLLDDRSIILENRFGDQIAILVNNPKRGDSPSSLDEHIDGLNEMYETLSDVKVGLEHLRIEFETLKYKYNYYKSNVCIIIYTGVYKFDE